MIDILHIESTDACNAACPQCAREYDTNFDKNNLHHLTIEQILNCLDNKTLTNLKKMFMCGDYGDPAAGKHTMQIYEFFRFINPSITLGMNSNGGLRNTDFWHKLGGILNRPQDYCIFSIDGLEDTNHIYRVNVNFKSVINNAKAFIDAGGIAHWDMLIFEHNEHQINEAKELARSLGFKWFRAKVSKRFTKHPISFLRPPKTFNLENIDGQIDCRALKEKSIYISAKGILHPCCWLGYSDGVAYNNFDKVRESWNTNQPNIICKETCGTYNGNDNFANQWRIEEELC